MLSTVVYVQGDSLENVVKQSLAPAPLFHVLMGASVRIQLKDTSVCVNKDTLEITARQKLDLVLHLLV